MRSRFLRSVYGILMVGLMMAAGPAVAQDFCGRNWVAAPNGFWNPTGTARVRAMTTWDPDGAGGQPTCLVAAGEFTLAGDSIAFGIAYYDGGSWRPIGNGLTGVVNSVAVFGGQLYAGGMISASGATPLNNFVRWTGSAWQNVQGGCDGEVTSIAAVGAEMLVGGRFTTVAGGALAYRYVARYAAGAWGPAGGTCPYPVDAVAIHQGAPVVICRNPSSPDNDSELRRFNGTAWVWLGTASGNALTVFGNEIYYTTYLRAGTFTTQPQCSRSGEHAIARHNGTTRTIQTSALYRQAYGFAVVGGQLHAIGFERRVCPYASGPDQNFIASLSGVTWTTTILPRSSGRVLCEWGGLLHMGGAFSKIGTTTTANCIAQYSGGQWYPMCNILNGLVRCSTSIGDALYVGGDFTASGPNALGRAAYFNGQTWRPVAPFNGSVYSMKYYSPNPQGSINAGLVVSGSFTSTGPNAASCIARFDQGTGNYVAMGAGLNAPALAMLPVGVTQFRTDLVVGGLFTTAGGVGANRVARWQLSSWVAMGTGMNNEVRALASYGGSIIAAGAFTTAGGNACNYIARWDGTNWQPFAGGLDNAARAMVVHDGRLIVAGDFQTAGGVACSRIAAWNGTAWTPIGAGLNNTVNALAVSGTNLIAGGSFTASGANPLSRMAEWNGVDWYPIGYDLTTPGGGVNTTVLTVAVASNGDLVAGGQFSVASGQFSPLAARAVAPGTLTVMAQPQPAQTCPGHEAEFTFTIQPGNIYSEASYLWYLGGNPLADGATANGTLVSLSGTENLHLSNVSPNDAGAVWCRATTPCGETVLSESADLTVGGANCCTSDFNGDGDFGTDADIEAFFACLGGNCCPTCDTSDFDGDGDTGTDADIEAFFRVLAGGAC